MGYGLVTTLTSLIRKLVLRKRKLRLWQHDFTNARKSFRQKELRLLALRRELEIKEKEIRVNLEEWTRRFGELNNRLQRIKRRERQTDVLRETLRDYYLRLKREEKRLEAERAKLEDAKSDLIKRFRDFRRMQNDLKKEQARITNESESTETLHQRLLTLESKIQEKQEELHAIQTLLTQRELEVSELRKGNRTLEIELGKLRTQLRIRDAEVEALKAEIRANRVQPHQPSQRSDSRIDPTQQVEGATQRVTTPTLRSPRVDILCWKEGWKWIVGFVVDEAMEISEVSQAGERLECHESNKAAYVLNYLSKPVTLEVSGREFEIPVQKTEREYLIFRMRNNWDEPGRLVDRTTSGYYLVIVPKSWTRDEEVNGPQPIDPEDVRLPNLCAHFFYLSRWKNEAIVFHRENGERIDIESGKPRFELRGSLIQDDADEAGPLFGPDPPQLVPIGEQGWTNVSQAEVDNQAKGDRRWRKRFDPTIQDLPGVLVSENLGWYSLRIYGDSGELLESTDFRFARGLKGIEIPAYSPLPEPRIGHRPIRVSFHHVDGYELHLVRRSAAELLIQRRTEATTVEIPADPGWDMTDWEIRYEGSRVPLEILIERVRWSLAEEGEEILAETAQELKDTPIEVEAEFFMPTSRKVICIWLPRPRWVNSVFVGFDRSRRRKYLPRTKQRQIQIPLRDFHDSQEIGGRSVAPELKLWVPDQSSETTLATVRRAVKRMHRSLRAQERQLDPSGMKCCSTCDHARTQRGSYWCRRYHWPRVVEWLYQRDFATKCCPEWRGELSREPENNV